LKYFWDKGFLNMQDKVFRWRIWELPLQKPLGHCRKNILVPSICIPKMISPSWYAPDHSVKWLEYQVQHLRINKIPFTNLNNCVLWLSTLMIKIWNHCYTLWESRNKDKHGHDTKTATAVLLAQVQGLVIIL
jgi:hypothetical protein